MVGATTPTEVEGDGDETLTEAQLEAALLTCRPADRLHGRPADEENDDGDQTTGDSAECSERFEELSGAEDQEAASASADFEGGFGVVLEQGLESYEDEETVTQLMDDVVDVLSDCPTFTTTDEAGEKTELSIGALSFPKLGDDTVALAVNGTSQDVDIRFYLVVVRLGRNVMSVTQGGLTADAAVLEQVARTGLAKSPPPGSEPHAHADQAGDAARPTASPLGPG